MWFNAVSRDIGKVGNALTYFEQELEEAVKDVELSGSVQQAIGTISGMVSYRKMQLAELNAIMDHLEILYRRQRSQTLRKFMEHYNRDLSATEAGKWVDGEPEVVAMAGIIVEVKFLRNKFGGIVDGLDIKGYQLSNIAKLALADRLDITI